MFLRQPKVDTNTIDVNGRTPLLLVLQEGLDDLAALLLSHPGTRVDVADNSGATALILASRGGLRSAAALLLARPDVQVNAVDEKGETALMNALESESISGDDGVLRLLLAHPGVNPFV